LLPPKNSPAFWPSAQGHRYFFSYFSLLSLFWFTRTSLARENSSKLSKNMATAQAQAIPQDSHGCVRNDGWPVIHARGIGISGAMHGGAYCYALHWPYRLKYENS
jgi:hypothetical protein